MLLSLPTDNLFNYFSTQEALQIIKNAGFDSFELTISNNALDGFNIFNTDYIERAVEINNISEQLGLKCNQVYVDFADYKKGDNDYNAKMINSSIRALEVCSILGAKICIIKPFAEFTTEENKRYIFDKLLPYCKLYNIKVAIENLCQEDFCKKVIDSDCILTTVYNVNFNSLDSDYFGACLNTRLAETFGGKDCVNNLVSLLGERLFALHISDNDRYADLSTFPYNGKIDWDEFLTTLKNSSYNGYFTFEGFRFIKKCPKEVKPFAIRFIYSIGKSLLGKIEG